LRHPVEQELPYYLGPREFESYALGLRLRAPDLLAAPHHVGMQSHDMSIDDGWLIPWVTERQTRVDRSPTVGGFADADGLLLAKALVIRGVNTDVGGGKATTRRGMRGLVSTGDGERLDTKTERGGRD
jgi:hypothetical protein